MADYCLTAVEFFSGIGAFCEATQNSAIDVVAAFDQNAAANSVYSSNFGFEPGIRNLDTIRASDIPEADIWWLSPPCTPFTRRGRQRDIEDARARSFLNLVSILPLRLPRFFILENVVEFSASRACALVVSTLESQGYLVRQCRICSTDFGVPMRRPRFFIVADREGRIKPIEVKASGELPLAGFLDVTPDSALLVDQTVAERYQAVLNVVDPGAPGASLICFTRGYRRCHRASGSLLQLPDGRLRYVAPHEILRLLGFSRQFSFPSEMPLSVRWKLVGNSVDVRVIGLLLRCIQQSLHDYTVALVAEDDMISE